MATGPSEPVRHLGAISPNDIRDTVELLSSVELHRLYGALDISHKQVEISEQNANSTDVNRKGKQVLLDWRQRKGRAATRNDILQALRRCQLNATREELEDKWAPKVVVPVVPVVPVVTVNGGNVDFDLDDIMDRYKLRPAAGTELKDLDLDHVIDQLKSPEKLDKLYSELGLQEREISEAKKELPFPELGPLVEAKSILRFWRSKNSCPATRHNMLTALITMNEIKSVKHLLDIWFKIAKVYHENNKANGHCMFKNKAASQEDADLGKSSLDYIPNFPYKRFKIKIEDSLTKDNIENAKRLLEEEEGFNTSMISEIESSKQLLNKLEEVRLLSKFNLVFLQVLLIYIEREDLKGHVDIYAKSIRTNSEKNPLHLTIAKFEGTFATEIKIAGEEKFITLTGETVDDYRRVLASRLHTKEHRIRFEAAGKGCLILVFHLPDEVKDDLRKAAVEQAQWLVALDVTGVHIRGENFISLTEVALDAAVDYDNEGNGDDQSDTLSHVTSTLQHEEKIQHKEEENELYTYHLPDRETSPTEGAAQATVKNVFDEDSQERIEDINRKIDRLLSPSGRSRYAPVPSVTKYIRKLQEDMYKEACTLKQKSLIFLDRGASHEVQPLLLVSRQLLADAIPLKRLMQIRPETNNTMSLKMLLARAECDFILAYFTCTVEQSMSLNERMDIDENVMNTSINTMKQIFYDEAKADASIVKGEYQGFSPACALHLLLSLIDGPSTDREQKERGLCSLLKKILRSTEEIQQHPTTRTALRILKQEISDSKWQEITKRSNQSAASDSGFGSGGSSLTAYETEGKRHRDSSSVKPASLTSQMSQKHMTSRRQAQSRPVKPPGKRRKKLETSQAFYSQSEVDMQSERTNSSTDSDIESQDLYCTYCKKYFQDSNEEEQHLETIAHKSKVIGIQYSDDGGHWKYRQPPPNIDGNFELCTSQKTCMFANVVDQENTCSKAHSDDELEEWTDRFQKYEAKIEKMVRRNRFSKMENLLTKYNLSDETKRENVLTSKATKAVPGVSVECLEELQQIIPERSYDHEHNRFQWTFSIHSTKKHPLRGVGLLLDENRNYFNIIDKQTNQKQQILTTKQVQQHINAYSGSEDRTTYVVTLEFSSSMLGVFKQWIVFDFGEKTHPYREVEIRVGSSDDNDFGFSQLPVEDEVWDKSHPDYVLFNDRDKSELSPEPVRERKHVDIPEVLDKENYKSSMLTLLDLEEQHRIDLLKRFRVATTLKVCKSINLTPLTYYEEAGKLYGVIDLTSVPLDDSSASQVAINHVQYVLIRF